MLNIGTVTINKEDMIYCLLNRPLHMCNSGKSRQQTQYDHVQESVETIHEGEVAISWN
jgi:hypothetical protein